MYGHIYYLRRGSKNFPVEGGVSGRSVMKLKWRDGLWTALTPRYSPACQKFSLASNKDTWKMLFPAARYELEKGR